MIQKQHLLSFIDRFNAYQIIRTHSFFSLYTEWFSEVTCDLQDEILENLSLTTTDKKDYLKYVKQQVVEKIVYENNTIFLDKWIKGLNLNNLEFPFFDDEVAQHQLAADIKDASLDYDFRKDCTNMQMDFYCHAAMIEKYKIIAFVDDLLKTYNKKQEIELVWFKVAVLFASGQLEKYYTINSLRKIVFKNGWSAPKIAKELGDEGYTKYISATFNQYGPENSNATKNIFNYRDRMLKIKSHCEEENIPVIQYFIDRIPPE